MKKVVTFLLCALLSIGCFSQQKGKAILYAYKQGVLPGVVPKHNISELPSNRPEERKARPVKPKFNYLIYLVSSDKVVPTEVWLNGIPQNVQYHNVDSTPVVLMNYNLPMHPKQAELVPKTSKRVIQLSPAAVKEESKTNEKLKKLAASNELVVVYAVGKKTYYVCTNKLNPLEPVATM